MTSQFDALVAHLRTLPPIAVAVSGGVDSLTLATLAHRVRGADTEMFHAVSTAVPAEATGRVREYALREGWTLHVIDAGEMNDAAYLRNPVNRCYFCKTDLYGSIAARTSAILLSGTNTDDLGDYRPGLKAALKHGVRHPYVDVDIDKMGVRAIARQMNLDDAAELPAAPCLASRIETGIPIAPGRLMFVHQIERALTELLNPETVRCRVRDDGVAIELDEAALRRMTPIHRQLIAADVRKLWPDETPPHTIEFESYRRGSAFLHLPKAN
ncbi:adenine nucleotide alpha hydrolase [Smaragdicoccus niigatensis]|uniref:adenine nucleotide alpha hydrolase n=1 Tax=Smaragdicoccus niigatensis TaxID=359359 RepID=UPI00036F8FDB|nr:adenine nucleotide alpha hydrolase [Smaragdicoccus niigatensis]